MKAKHVVVSTDLPLKANGDFYANASNPQDPGVAVYFTWKGTPYQMACDRFPRIWENVRAIALTIESMRAIERHGASHLLERAVSGFRALPPGDGSTPAAPPARPWWDVFGVADVAGTPASEIAANPDHVMRKPLLSMVETVYRQNVAANHPDKGGDPAVMAEINLAIAAARKELETQ